MKMVRSDLAASGVIFTLDTESGFRDVVFVTGSWGLGENIVQGKVDPDEFYVHKPTFRQGYRAVLSRRLGKKQTRLVYARGHGDASTRNLPTRKSERERSCLTDAEVLELADSAIRIEDHYSELAGHPTPMDIEWAKDGEDGKLYIVQARPETVASRRAAGAFETYALKAAGPVLATGRAVGEKIASGKVRVVADPHDLAAFHPGEVLVAEATSPDWEPVMKTAAAIVTSRGGRTCHAAIVARELGVPAVVGAEGATERLATGNVVTVSCADGEVGKVYDGALPFEVTRVPTAALPRPRTKIMVNLGNPELAYHTAMLPNDGVGLARMEFIVNEHIGVHPMALACPEKVASKKARAEIARLVRNYARPTDFFVEKLAEGVGTIAAAFYPRPVILRLSDFKTNEYASLLGGAGFEPKEENPMLGFRGAARYAHPAYAAGFALECAALARVRNEMGLTNLCVMVPFCRRVAEGKAGDRDDGAARAPARRQRARDLRHVRDPQQRHPNRCFCGAVRRLLDRLERPDAIDPGGRPGFRDCRLRLRRARSRHARNAPARGDRRQTQPSSRRDLRRGAGELPGGCALSRRARDRLDQRQCREPVAHHHRRATKRSRRPPPARWRRSRGISR